MAETFCGKSCAECTYKEELNCPGCKAGPGVKWNTDCGVAECCQSKGHKECSTCNFCGHCGMLQSSIRMPQFRLEKIAADAAWKKEIAHRAKKVHVWLAILFWLIIPSVIAGLLSSASMASLFPALRVPALILSIICSLVYGISLLYMASQEDRYKTAGICVILCALWNCILIATNGNENVRDWIAVLSIPVAIIAYVGEYNEMTAHSIILTGIDVELSEKWSKLWKWFIGSYGAILGGTLLTAIFGLLGLMLVLAGAVGIIVVEILKLVYLYRTKSAFQEYLEYSVE